MQLVKRNLVELIYAKRDGQKLSTAEIKHLVTSLGDGQMADYQMVAFLMAVFFRGLDDEETVALTQAFLESGRVLDLSHVPGIKVDKHSTGGVGDKVSLCLVPIVAACGIPVPMVSGRGLGHTGGTLDKLEAIPGFRTQLEIDEFSRVVADVGGAIVGATKEIAPADKRIYALRDVTATIESIPLIVASILSKKLAEGTDALVLDVKVGRGAFMKTEADARTLATALVRVGTLAGKKVVALLTDMNAPLGEAVGNANEVREALEILHGRGPSDVRECTMLLGAEMLVLAGKAADADEARAKLDRAISSGAAVEAMEKIVAAQHGDPRVVREPSRLEIAPIEVPIVAEREGFVTAVDAFEIGLSAVAMGAGRTRPEQTVDHAVGISIRAKPGARVSPGTELACVHVRSKESAEPIAARVRAAFTLGDAPPPRQALFYGRID